MDERQREIARLRAEIAAEEAQLNSSEPENTSLSREEEMAQLRGEIAADEEALGAPQDISRSPGKAALRQVGRIGRAGLTGLAGLADIPNLAAMGAHAAGLKETPTFYDPIADRVQGYIDRETKGKLRAENKAEEYADTILEGLAPLAASAVTGGASLTSLAAKNAAKLAGKGGAKKALETVSRFGSKTYKPTSLNVAGSLGSSVAGKTYLENAENPSVLGSLAAGMAGGLGGSSAANYKNIAAKSAGKITRFDPNKYREFSELGIPASLANTSKGTVPSKIENIVSHTLGFENQFKKHYGKQESAIARNMGISTPDNLEGAVTGLPRHLAKKGAQGYKDKISSDYEAKASTFKDLEKEAIFNREQLDVSNLINDLEKERSLALTSHTRGLFDKTKKGKLLRDLRGAIPGGEDSIAKSKAISDIQSMDATPQIKAQMLKKYKESTANIEPVGTGVGYHDLDQMRKKALQESIEAQTPMGGSTPESREASEISSILSNRRHQFVEERGTPKQAQSSREAKKMYAEYKADPHMNEQDGMSHYVEHILGSENHKKGFDKLKTEPRFLKVAREGLPKDERPKLAEAMIADAGDKNGKFSINKAHAAYSKYPEDIKNEFLKTLGDKKSQENFRKTMDLVDENKKMMSSIANTSNTAHTTQTMNLIKKAGTIAGYATVGNLAAVPSVVGAALAKGGAKLWTDQKFLARVNDSMTATTPKQLQAALKAVNRSANQAGRQTKEHSKANKVPIIDVGRGGYVPESER